jgi:hypothetical protein
VTLMPQSVSMNVDAFRQILKQEVEAICKDNGKSYDREADRGYAFELWAAELLIKNYDLEIDPHICTFRARDLKIDIAFDDEESKSLVLAQTKFVSVSANPDISEDECVTFFDRHDVFMKQTDWLRDHASDELHDLISDYQERVLQEWNINFYFISTGKASERIKKLIGSRQQEIKNIYPNVSLYIWDFYQLKEEYIRSQSVEATISDAVKIDFPVDKFVVKEDPHKTILAIVKGTTLAALYKKERERLFAYNIRTFLGKRVNKAIIDTAITKPEEFYYFNNGVSAVCTHIHHIGENKYRFDNFQIINGAQTVGSLAQIPSLDHRCEVVLRITEGVSVKTEKGFNADIILYNNTQNVVRASDFRANDNIQLWLEERFLKTKARGALTHPMRYVRKRSYKRVRGAIAVKFEELAKIRYAFYYEPTQCVADPRSLWTTKEDGGLYERAFGIDGALHNYFTDDEFSETTFAIIVFLAIMEKIKSHIQHDKTNYYFLQRLRFWALSLARVHVEKRKIQISELMTSRKKFEDWFAGFWRDIFRDLVQASRDAQESKISNFALARNETRWNKTKNTVELILGADLG